MSEPVDTAYLRSVPGRVTVFEPVVRWLMARRLRAELAELKPILELTIAFFVIGYDTTDILADGP